MAERYDIGNDDYPFVRGDDFSLSVEWQDSNEDPVEIASCRLQVRRRPDSEDALLSFTDADPELSISGGTVDINFTDTGDFPTGRPFYDLEVVSDGDQVKTLIEGRFIVQEDVSR